MKDTDSLTKLIQEHRDGHGGAFNILFTQFPTRLVKVDEAHPL